MPTIDVRWFRSCTGGKTEDFLAAAQLLYKAGDKVKVPTYLVPATQRVWADVYGLPVPGCDGRTAAQIFADAGCESPASPSCAACLGRSSEELLTMPGISFRVCDERLMTCSCCPGGPQDTYARMNEAQTCVSTTNR